MTAPESGRLRAVWGTIAVGERVGPRSLAVPRVVQEERLEALGVTHPWLRGGPGAPAGAPVLLPILFQDLYFALAESRWDWGLPVAARLTVETLSPAGPDAVHTGWLTVTDRVERRGGLYVASDLDVTDPGGTPVARLRNLTLLNPDEVYRRRAAAETGGDSGGAEADARVASAASAAPPAPLPEVGRRRATLEAFRRWDGGRRNHHTDAAEAARIGLPAPLAPGLMLVGYLYEALLARHGAAWLHGSRLSVTYTGPVWAGETLVVRASRPDGAGPARLAIDTAEGRRVLVGEASLDDRRVLAGEAFP